MDKRIGSSAGILALLAVVLHTFVTPGADRSSSFQDKKEAVVVAAEPRSSERSTTGKHSAARLRAAERQGPWRATQQYFHSRPGERDDDVLACKPLDSAVCSRKFLLAQYGFPSAFAPENIHSLVATVPDPLHTRMSVETDRYLDAIQQAAFRSGWELATQWLPWTAKVASTQDANAQEASSEGFDVERLPGLLVFRPHFEPHSSTNRLLLVFVVGETPTAGINGFQFEAARETVFGLGSDQPGQLSIAGPNFSGSFLPLTRLLEESPGTTHFELRAGSVSNSEYARAMLLELQAKGFGIDKQAPGHPWVTFHGSTLPSESFHSHFVRLVRQLGLRADQAAELMEDETAFSFTDPDLHKDNDDFPIATYRYPRDIAQLRNIYNDAAFAGTPQPQIKSTPAVDFSLKDTQSGEDVFPMFSTSHTPISQYAELQQVIYELKSKSIRVVSLSATNVFDALFLANVMARNCPDTRIVIRGPDLLFVQEAAQGTLAGLMAISPFPLFPEGTDFIRRRGATKQDPSPKKGSADITAFATADQIGEVDAVAALLERPAASHETHAYSKVDGEPFEPAFARDDFSSAWVLVLGPRGWLPITLFNQINRKLSVVRQDPLWFDPKESSTENKISLGGLTPATLGWNTLCMLMAAFSLGFCGRLFYLQAHPHKLVWSSLCLIDLGKPAQWRAISETAHSRYICMLSCFASLALVDGLLLCPMLVARIRYAGSVGPMIEMLVAAAFLVSLGTAVYLAFVIRVRISRQDPTTDAREPALSWWSVALRAGILGLALAGVYVWWRCCDNGIPGYMLCFRTLTLAAPVCPLWPLLLTGGGLFCLAYFHLRRFTWGDQRQPYLETLQFDEALCNEFVHLKERLERGLLRPFSIAALPGLPMLALAAVVFMTLLWILIPADALGSFEPESFSRLLLWLLFPLAFFTLFTFVRFSWCWGILRAFLVSLNSVVLGRYFMRIPEFSGSGPVWIREVKMMSLATAVNSSIALHNLEVIQRTPGVYNEEFLRDLRNFLSPSNGHGTRLDFIRAYEKFRKTAGAITKTLGVDVLRAYWTEHELPFVGLGISEGDADTVVEKAKPNEKTLAAAVGGLPSLTQTMPDPGKASAKSVSIEAYEQGSKYVALQYCVYIGYVLHHLQNLLLCCVVCFVLLVAALNSFSFQAPQAIFHFLTVALLVAAGAVLLVFAQMERDPILSRLSGTPEGELGKDFYVRAVVYGALPVLSVLGAQFPAITRSIAAWLQPATAGLH